VSDVTLLKKCGSNDNVVRKTVMTSWLVSRRIHRIWSLISELHWCMGNALQIKRFNDSDSHCEKRGDK